MSLRTPLGRVLGLGSAKDGTAHWWVQRLTALGLIPLGLWLVASLALFDDLGYAAVNAWIGKPLNAILLGLTLATLIYHSKLGVQVILEDYVHGWLKVTSLITSTFVHFAVAAAGLFAVLKIAFGAGA